jgi:polyisoprenoid-binding protein YceI
MIDMTRIRTVVGVGLLAIALIVSVFAYNVLRTPAEASGPIEAIPLAESTAAPTESSPTTQPTAEAATTAITETPPTSTPAATATAEAEAASAPVVMQIVQAESEARFIIDEVLNNAPKTVVGTTEQVAGEIAINPSDPSQSRVGVIQVNARTLVTDNDFRNRAIKNQILQTDQYEFVTFTPREIVGLPQSGEVGQSYTFQIVGDLTIRDVSREVTFDVTVTPVSESRVEGTASATILYADYGITIPQVRQVASVDEDVRLEIDFVATPS